MGERTVRHWIVRLAPLLGVVALAALILAMGWNRYLSLDTLKDHGEALHAFVADHYLLTLLGLTLLFALLTASVIPGVVFVTVAAGYLYGTWVGGVATTLGATLGALIVYGAGRSALGEALRARAAARPGLIQRICKGVDRDTFRYVLVSRLIVTVPFHLINVAAGIVSAPLRPYALATFLGLLPAHFIYCWIGAGLNDILSVNEDPDLRALFNEFLWPLMGVAFLALVLPLIMRRLGARDPETAA
ncbi:VTT domain-containing protein [Brevundimonas sp.]|uniref:TVP38/TMEM64 family protein n=1 Tax=Brevundimonas sp. TaxID=1871086 RepID=UPI001D6DF654|nr:VTT domain-containing protein [Brevundimonas sp.]MBA4000704.1 SNARE-like domain protein [Brevundimonas sp.]